MASFLRLIGLFIFFIFCAQHVHAQRIILNEKVVPIEEDTLWGPNAKHYFQLTFEAHSLVGKNQTEAAPLKLGLSSAMRTGFIYTEKLAKALRLYTSFALSKYSYQFKQDTATSFPSYYEFSKEKINLGFAEAGLGLRIKLSPSESSYSGPFIDLYAWAGFPFAAKYVFKTESIDPNGIVVRNKYSSTYLPYIQPFAYGVAARIGGDGIALSASMRFSTLFTQKYGYMPDLAVFTIGLTLSTVHLY